MTSANNLGADDSRWSVDHLETERPTFTSRLSQALLSGGISAVLALSIAGGAFLLKSCDSRSWAAQAEAKSPPPRFKLIETVSAPYGGSLAYVIRDTATGAEYMISVKGDALIEIKPAPPAADKPERP